MNNDHANDVLVGRDGSYALLDVIGKGAYGTVYKGIWRERGRHVAVKRVSRTRLSDDENQALQAEILLFKNLSHKHIVNYVEAVDDAQSPYLDIVMEYVEGGSLHSLVHSIRRSLDASKPIFEEPVVADFVRQVVRGLRYLHHQGVVHRDIKGANILITKEGHCKLADFGVSSTKPNDSSSTSFDVAGSPYWMAPEIINLTGSSTASDIWSLGCTVIELLTGHPPYHQYADITALFKIVSDECPPLPPNLSADCEDFLRKCFNKDVHLRATADDLLSHRWLVQVDGLLADDNLGLPSPVDPFSSPLESSAPVSSQPNATAVSLDMYEEDGDVDEFDDLDFESQDTPGASDRGGASASDAASFDRNTLTMLSPLPRDGILVADRSNLSVGGSSFSDSRFITRAMRSISFREDPFKDVGEDPEVDRERERLRRQKELWQLVKMHVSALGTSVDGHIAACDGLIDLFKRNPEQKHHLIYDPGLLPILEVLESGGKGNDRVVEAMLRVTLSFLDEENTQNGGELMNVEADPFVWRPTGEVTAFGYPRVSNIREDLCLAGFLPVVMRYCSRKESFKSRLLAARFLDKMLESKDVLHMFIACRGFSVFVEMLEPDIAKAGDLSRIALREIDRLLSMDNQRHKRDFCRRFSWNGLLDRLVDGISFNMACVHHGFEGEGGGNGDTKGDTKGVDEIDGVCSKEERIDHVCKLASLLQTFAARADPTVKAKMTTANVLSAIIAQVSSKFVPPQALTSLLSCVRDLSRDPQTHEALQSAGAIATLIRCLSEERGRETSCEHFIISTLHNVCIVSHGRQEIAARAGVVSHLQRYIISKDMNVRSLCIDMYSGMGCAGHAAREELGKEGGVDFYVELLVMLCGPGTVRKWQARVLQSLAEWVEDEGQMKVVEERLCAERNRTRFCQSLGQVWMPELEGVLEPYLRIVTVSGQLNQAFGCCEELVVTMVRWLEDMYGHGSGSGIGSGSGSSGGCSGSGSTGSIGARGRLLLLRTLVVHGRLWRDGGVSMGIVSGLHVLLEEVVLVRERAITVSKQAEALLHVLTNSSTLPSSPSWTSLPTSRDDR